MKIYLEELSKISKENVSEKLEISEKIYRQLIQKDETGKVEFLALIAENPNYFDIIHNLIEYAEFKSDEDNSFSISEFIGKLSFIFGYNPGGTLINAISRNHHKFSEYFASEADIDPESFIDSLDFINSLMKCYELHSDESKILQILAKKVDLTKFSIYWKIFLHDILGDIQNKDIKYILDDKYKPYLTYNNNNIDIISKTHFLLCMNNRSYFRDFIEDEQNFLTLMQALSSRNKKEVWGIFTENPEYFKLACDNLIKHAEYKFGKYDQNPKINNYSFFRSISDECNFDIYSTFELLKKLDFVWRENRHEIFKYEIFNNNLTLAKYLSVIIDMNFENFIDILKFADSSITGYTEYLTSGNWKERYYSSKILHILENLSNKFSLVKPYIRDKIHKYVKGYNSINPIKTSFKYIIGEYDSCFVPARSNNRDISFAFFLLSMDDQRCFENLMSDERNLSDLVDRLSIYTENTSYTHNPLKDNKVIYNLGLYLSKSHNLSETRTKLLNLYLKTLILYCCHYNYDPEKFNILLIFDDLKKITIRDVGDKLEPQKFLIEVSADLFTHSDIKYAANMMAKYRARTKTKKLLSDPESDLINFLVKDKTPKKLIQVILEELASFSDIIISKVILRFKEESAISLLSSPNFHAKDRDFAKLAKYSPTKLERTRKDKLILNVPKYSPNSEIIMKIIRGIVTEVVNNNIKYFHNFKHKNFLNFMMNHIDKSGCDLSKKIDFYEKSLREYKPLYKYIDLTWLKLKFSLFKIKNFGSIKIFFGNLFNFKSNNGKQNIRPSVAYSELSEQAKKCVNSLKKGENSLSKIDQACQIEVIEYIAKNGPISSGEKYIYENFFDFASKIIDKTPLNSGEKRRLYTEFQVSYRNNVKYKFFDSMRLKIGFSLFKAKILHSIKSLSYNLFNLKINTTNKPDHNIEHISPSSTHVNIDKISGITP